jgi:hypothetical protein
VPLVPKALLRRRKINALTAPGDLLGTKKSARTNLRFSHGIFYAIGLFIVTVLVGLIAVGDGLTSPVLWADDGNWLAPPVIPDTASGGLSPRDFVLRTLLEFGGISLLRIHFLALHGLSVVLLFWVSRPILGSRLAVLPALMFGVFWFDPRLGIFVIGSEGPPSAIWVVGLFGLFLLFMYRHDRRTRVTASVLLGVVAILAVDNAFYAPLLGFMPFFWTGLATISSAVPVRGGLFGIVATAPAFAYALSQRLSSPNHYFSLGWTESSVVGVVQNFPRFLELFVKPSQLPFIAIAVLLAALIVAQGHKFVQMQKLYLFLAGSQRLRETVGGKSEKKSALVILAAAIILMGSTVLPILVVSNTPYDGRYSWAAGASVIILTLTIVPLVARRLFALRVVALLAATFIIFGFFERLEVQNKEVAEHSAGAPRLEALVNNQQSLWPRGSQIVILTDNLACCGRFNHWSSGNLRSISGREDITGLIGRVSQLNPAPLVTEWRHDGWWHETEPGRLGRSLMKGLEVNAGPLFLYDLDREEFQRPLPVHFTNGSCEISVEPGESIMLDRTEEDERESAFVWGVEDCGSDDFSERDF